MVLDGVACQESRAFVTFTSKLDMEWPKLMRRFQSLVRALRKGEKGPDGRWRRTPCPGLEYAAFKEEGACHGMKHLHVIFVGWLWVPKGVLQRMWCSRTGAFMVDVKRINGKDTDCARYAGKYVTKALGEVGSGDAPEYLRKRVTFSKGWVRSKPRTLEELLGDDLMEVRHYKGSGMGPVIGPGDVVLRNGMVVRKWSPAFSKLVPVGGGPGRRRAGTTSVELVRGPQ